MNVLPMWWVRHAKDAEMSISTFHHVNPVNVMNEVVPTICAIPKMDIVTAKIRLMGRHVMDVKINTLASLIAKHVDVILLEHRKAQLALLMRESVFAKKDIQEINVTNVTEVIINRHKEHALVPKSVFFKSDLVQGILFFRM